MKSQRNIAPLPFGLTLTLVALMSWNTLLIHFPERAVQAATRARVTEPTGQPVSRATANGRVAFVSSVAGNPDIYTINPDGSDRKQLTFSHGDEAQYEPVWSPDGTKIAFARQTHSVNGREIFVMNADGSDQRRLTQSRFDISPTWSPDGTKIAFSSIRNNFGIYVMNADGTNQTQLPNSDSAHSPRWAPNSLRIAFNSSRDGNNEIYVMNADGGNVQRLTNNPEYDSTPEWSPDGTRIAFVSTRDEPNAEIYVMNVDGGNVQRLTNNPGLDGFPRWSPDGTRIVFQSFRGGDNYDIYVMNSDGSNQTRLTNTPADSHFSPIFSPDGTRIAFLSGYVFGDEIISSQIYVMNADGSNPVRLTAANVYETQLDWQALSLTSPSCPNPIDCAEFFVRQQYLDFLAREPEPNGLTAWLNVLNNCPAGDLNCVQEQRLTTSAAFFGSPEFQLKGYFVFRFYRAAFARLPEYSEISADMRSVTGQTPDDVYSRKSAFTNTFVQRSEFVSLFNGLPNSDYVAALLGRYNLTSIITPDPAQPDGSTKLTLTQSQLVSHLEAGTLTRAQVLRAIADSDEVLQAEFNRAFVAMQYYGYLGRTPESTGYNSWLNYLNAHPGDFREMVRGFVDSIEYRMRFGQP